MTPSEKLNLIEEAARRSLRQPLKAAAESGARRTRVLTIWEWPALEAQATWVLLRRQQDSSVEWAVRRVLWDLPADLARAADPLKIVALSLAHEPQVTVDGRRIPSEESRHDRRR